jgi:hypothetical protein
VKGHIMWSTPVEGEVLVDTRVAPYISVSPD